MTKIYLPSTSRKPVAYRLLPPSLSAYSHDIEFYFPERKEFFILKNSNRDTFWFDYCKDCNLLAEFTCVGGDTYIPSITAAHKSKIRCFHSYNYNMKAEGVAVNLPFHAIKFRSGSSPQMFFLADDDLEGHFKKYYFYLGNVSDYLCTKAVFNNNLDIFLDELFTSIWNADYSYNWRCYFADSSDKAPDYSPTLHKQWLENIDYAWMMKEYGSIGKSISYEELIPISSEESFIII